MLIGYLDMFYALLTSRVELLVQEKILETHLLELCQPASRQFIMDPDTSSIIIKLYNDFQNKIHTTQESQDFAQFLVKEFHIFKNADTQDLLMNM